MSMEFPLVSILLPSVRPDPVRQRIQDFAQTDPDVDYEIVVVSEFPISGEKVVYVPETVRKGACGAQTEAYLHSRGEYIVWMSDDAIPTPHCIRNIVAFVMRHKSPFIASFRCRDGKTQFQERWQGVIYGKVYAMWGAATRETIESLGGFFDPAYRALYCDPDLGMRCWKAGGRVKVCPNAWIVHNDIKDDLKGAYHDKWAKIDSEIFHGRWDPVLARTFFDEPRPHGGTAPPFPIWVDPVTWGRWCFPILPAILREFVAKIFRRSPIYPWYLSLKSKIAENDLRR